VTATLALYRIATTLLEPFAPALVRNRVKSGKERAERTGERFGRTGVARPSGPLLWMHGASVGESKLLLDLFEAVRRRRPDTHALVTTQTTTSADMITSKSPAGVIHQMAPVDAPGAVARFLEHWRPDAAVFAEGEIWPNMLLGLKRARIPGALVNARMTTKTLASWNGRKTSAQELFATFNFIGAADLPNCRRPWRSDRPNDSTRWQSEDGLARDASARRSGDQIPRRHRTTRPARCVNASRRGRFCT